MSLNKEPQTQSRLLFIQGMTCTNCERRIEKCLSSLKGITKAEASYASSSVLVQYDQNQTGLEEMKNALSSIGYLVSCDPEALH